MKNKIIEEYNNEFQSIITLRRKGGITEMVKEKFKGSKKIESELIFRHQDQYMARFSMGKMPGFLSKKVIEIDPKGVFPTDFDVEKYAVTGKITISIEVKEK